MTTPGRPRLCDSGLPPGNLSPGGGNAIADVRNVRVGHSTLVSGDGSLSPGRRPARTGVTVILSYCDDAVLHRVRAAMYTINGCGKICGFEQVRGLGLIEAPIALTNTLNVGPVADALIQHTVQRHPTVGISMSSVNVVVGETNDRYLDDLQGRHVRAQHIWAAIGMASSGAVSEGAVEATTDTSCYGWKGGVGTASRVLPPEPGRFTVGAVVQTHFGPAEQLTVLGVPIGRWLRPCDQTEGMRGDHGSVMVVLTTDAPMTATQLHRLCVRAGVGLARTGSFHDHGSGDLVTGFSTACPSSTSPTC